MSYLNNALSAEAVAAYHKAHHAHLLDMALISFTQTKRRYSATYQNSDYQLELHGDADKMRTLLDTQVLTVEEK